MPTKRKFFHAPWNLVFNLEAINYLISAAHILIRKSAYTRWYVNFLPTLTSMHYASWQRENLKLGREKLGDLGEISNIPCYVCGKEKFQ